MKEIKVNFLIKYSYYKKRFIITVNRIFKINNWKWVLKVYMDFYVQRT